MTKQTASADIREAMDIRIIKSDEQYQRALDEVGRPAEIDPSLESAEGARLELLAKLVEDYEKERFLRLSWMEDGPRLASNFLAERGIALVIEPHLLSTLLDGAAMIGLNGAPVIGITIREDRLDNFWFTLMHELVHAWKHLDNDSHRAIADENIEKPSADAAGIEREANEFAAEILIDQATWHCSQARLSPSAQTIQDFATRMQVSPAVVAGRIRHEHANYSLFSKLVGRRKVRAIFPEVKWL